MKQVLRARSPDAAAAAAAVAVSLSLPMHPHFPPPGPLMAAKRALEALKVVAAMEATERAKRAQEAAQAAVAAAQAAQAAAQAAQAALRPAPRVVRPVALHFVGKLGNAAADAAAKRAAATSMADCTPETKACVFATMKFVGRLTESRCIYPACDCYTNIGELCAQHANEVYGIELALDPRAGYGMGLRATRELPPDCIVCPYGGKQTTNAELDAVYGPKNTASYALAMGGSIGTLDAAATKRGYGAMANHSENPNAHFVRWTGKRRSALPRQLQPYAVWLSVSSDEPVLAGDFLEVNYGTAYDFSRSPPHATIEVSPQCYAARVWDKKPRKKKKQPFEDAADQKRVCCEDSS